MPTPSAIFTVNGSPVTEAIAVAAESTVQLALASTFGVSTVQWSIVGNHSPDATNPTITPTGSPSGIAASFVMPAGASQGYLVECRINSGRDSLKRKVPGYTFRAIVGVGDPVPFVLGEKLERHPIYGWMLALNGLGGGGPVAAEDVSYDNSSSGLSATDVQAAIDEVADKSLIEQVNELDSFDTAISLGPKALGFGEEIADAATYVAGLPLAFLRRYAIRTWVTATLENGDEYTLEYDVAISMGASSPNVINTRLVRTTLSGGFASGSTGATSEGSTRPFKTYFVAIPYTDFDDESTTSIVDLGALPGDAVVVSAESVVGAAFAGGTSIAAVVSIGTESEPTAFVDQRNVFTGADAGIEAGNGVRPTGSFFGETLRATIELTGDDADNLDQGEFNLWVHYLSYEEPQALPVAVSFGWHPSNTLQVTVTNNSGGLANALVTSAVKSWSPIAAPVP